MAQRCRQKRKTMRQKDVEEKEEKLSMKVISYI